MSTRSIIGTGTVDNFTGRYCHLDGYPTCRGSQLIETFEELGNAQAVIDHAIRPVAKGYWSSYATPSRAAQESKKPDKVTCNLCGGTGKRTDMEVHNGCNGCQGTGIGRNWDKLSTWVRNDDEGLVSSGESIGAVWAYLLDEAGITVCIIDGYDPDTWKFVAWVDWKGNTDWAAIEKIGYPD